MNGPTRPPLRFCMITSFYPPYNFGGDGIYVHRLSNELARRGNLVDVIHCVDAYNFAAPPPSTGYRDHPNVTVHGLKSGLGMLSPLATQQTGFPLMKSRRIREILSKGFDVIHYHNISLVGGPGVLAFGDAIKLYTMHDYWLICPTHGLFRFNRAPCARPTFCAACTLVYKRPPQLWRYFGLMESAIKNVDAFIAPSLTSQRKHEQLGLKGRIVHLPNFVSICRAPGKAQGLAHADTGILASIEGAAMDCGHRERRGCAARVDARRLENTFPGPSIRIGSKTPLSRRHRGAVSLDQLPGGSPGIQHKQRTGRPASNHGSLQPEDPGNCEQHRQYTGAAGADRRRTGLLHGAGAASGHGPAPVGSGAQTRIGFASIRCLSRQLDRGGASGSLLRAD